MDRGLVANVQHTFSMMHVPEPIVDKAKNSQHSFFHACTALIDNGNISKIILK